MAAQCRLTPSVPGVYSLTTVTPGNAFVSYRALRPKAARSVFKA